MFFIILFILFRKMKGRIILFSSFILVVFSAYFTQIPFKISPDPLRRREEVWKTLYWIIFLSDFVNYLVPTYSLNIAGIIAVIDNWSLWEHVLSSRPLSSYIGLANVLLNYSHGCIANFYRNFTNSSSNSGGLF